MTISLSGTNGVTFPDSSLQAAAASPYVLKNRIINGDMRIDQRNAGAAVTINNAADIYTLDRFSAIGQTTDGVYTVQRSTVAPTGFVNSLLVTVTTADASIGSGQFYDFSQFIEGLNVADLGWGTANAQTVTLSFWVRSSVTGTFGGAIRNSSFNRSYPFSYVISAANTWEYKTITISGDTSGTWLTTNGIGLGVTWSLGEGSSRLGTAGSWSGSNFAGATGQTNLISTLNATLYLTGVQLEVGTSATPFERRLYNQELANCYRYCWNLSAVGGNDNYSRFGVGGAENTTSTEITIPFPVTMRANPSLTTTGTASNYAIYSAGTITAVSSITMTGAISAQTGLINASVASGLTAGRETTLLANNNKTAYLLFTAEL